MTVMRICTKCNQEKPLKEFPKDKKRYQGHRSECKQCVSIYNKQYYKVYYKTNIQHEKDRGKKYRKINKERCHQRSNKYYNTHKKEKRQYYDKNLKHILKGKQKSWYKRMYGMTVEQKKEMLKSQHYKCLICDKNLHYSHKRMVCVDHNHDTGKVRGILCRHCNCTLGLVHENINTLHNMINYVIKYNNVSEEGCI